MTSHLKVGGGVEIVLTIVVVRGSGPVVGVGRDEEKVLIIEELVGIVEKMVDMIEELVEMVEGVTG